VSASFRLQPLRQRTQITQVGAARVSRPTAFQIKVSLVVV